MPSIWPTTPIGPSPAGCRTWGGVAIVPTRLTTNPKSCSLPTRTNSPSAAARSGLGTAGTQRKITSLEGAENAVQLPSSQDRLAGAVCKPLLAAAEGEFVRVGKLQDLGLVVSRVGTIATPPQVRHPAGLGPIGVVGHIDGMRPGVSALQKKAARHAPVEAHLH